MQLSFLVAKALMEGDFATYFASVPSSLDDGEPIVLRQGAFEREAVLDGCERGRVPVRVLVVRDEESEAEAVAEACERWVRRYGWEPVAENGSWRVCGIDTSAPAAAGRDDSGRYVWAFEVGMTVVRSL